MRLQILKGWALGLLTAAAPGIAAAQAAQAQWDQVPQVIAFADVHGAYAELHALLGEIGVIDAQDHWAAGSKHVVSLGDLLDRGPDARKVMDLLMRLQSEAQSAGGQLHVLLGNHEAMNLQGDLRYGSVADYAAYTDLESAAERDAARQAWQAHSCSGPCPDFDKQFPPGYFGRKVALGPTGRYGQWLLGLPVAIRINDTLFMHGGASAVERGLTLTELNLRYRTALADYVGLEAQLESAQLLQPGDDYGQRLQLAQQRLAARGGTPDAALTDAIRRFAAAEQNPLLSDDGPNWYRGQALCREVTETDVLLPLLQQFGAARLIIGHTPTRNGRAVMRFDGRVIKLDTGMNHAAFKGRPTALFMDGAGLLVHYAGEAGNVPLQPEGLFVAPDELDDDTVQAALRDGEIGVTGPRGPDEMNVSVTYDGRRIPAVFQVRDDTAVKHELAALRLDRLLQLGLVPATAAREVQGRQGLLQARPQKWLSQADIQKQGVRGGGWCAMEPQSQLMYAFDTLTGDGARTGASIVMDTANWYLYATSFAQAFGTGKGLPEYLRAHPPAPGAELRRRLQGLDAAALDKSLGDLLDKRARAAILTRRDTLLALPAAATSAAR